MNRLSDSSTWPRGFRFTAWVLRWVVALQCFAVAAHRFDMGLESPVGGVLFFEWDWSESTMLQVEDYAAGAMAVAGVLTLFRPCWPVLFPVAAWMALIPLAGWHRDEGFIPWLEPIEHAVRFLAPLALAMLEFYPPRASYAKLRSETAMWLLRLGAAATFFGHGWAALEHNPHFIDLILTAGDRLASLTIAEDTARTLLTLIGAVDFAVAFNLLWARLPPVALWMVFWGVITAASRVVYFGFDDGYARMLIRAANGGAPMVLALWWLLVTPNKPNESA